MIEWEYVIALVAILFGSLIFIIPLAAFALRYASKPLIEAFARYKEVQGGPPADLAALRERVAVLEEKLEGVEWRLEGGGGPPPELGRPGD